MFCSRLPPVPLKSVKPTQGLEKSQSTLSQREQCTRQRRVGNRENVTISLKGTHNTLLKLIYLLDTETLSILRVVYNLFETIIVVIFLMAQNVP